MKRKRKRRRKEKEEGGGGGGGGEERWRDRKWDIRPTTGKARRETANHYKCPPFRWLIGSIGL
jgi:hypothetical protein